MKISRVLALFICMSAPTSLFAQIDPYKSLVIRDHRVLNTINSPLNPSLDFGYLLGDVGNWTRDNFNNKLFDGAKNWRPKWGAGHYVYYTLNDAALDQENHTNAAPIQKLGGAYNSDRTFRHILNKWGIGNNLNDLKTKYMTPDSLRDLKDLNGNKIGSPFRLLAIVNRMDVAGDMDDRGTSHTTAFPRPFGEIHLIYGFIDENYEKSGTAYPATFVLAYRLPIINLQGDVLVEETMGMENSSSSIEASDRMDALNRKFIDMIDHKFLENRSAWDTQMSLWAGLWQSLSNESIGSAQYNEKLRRILALSIHPRNFLQLRSNFQVNEQEFELREWYIVQSTQALIKRKPRDEVYKCQSGQPELTRIVNHFWNPHYLDLDMTSRSLHDRALQGGRDGYTVPRDGGIPTENTSLLRTILTPFLNTTGQLTQLTGCGDGSAVPPIPAPFEMVAAGNAAIPGNRIVYAPPFARVQRNDVWEIGVTPNRERKRHAFAIRTCSGCHGQEAGAFGFHIAPRLELQNSRLSGFMTGVGANKFIKNGVTYQYKELENRKNWLQKALDKNATLFDSLKRNDR